MDLAGNSRGRWRGGSLCRLRLGCSVSRSRPSRWDFLDAIGHDRRTNDQHWKAVMGKAAIILAFCSTAALAESNFRAPLIGIARDARQQLRFVHGVSGNFVLRQAIANQVRDWTFAGFGGLVKTETALLVLDANAEVVRQRPIPDADVALSPGPTQLAALYFARSESELWTSGAVADRKVRIEPDAIAGTVIALGPSGRNHAVLAVCRADYLWLLTVNLRAGTVTAERTLGGTIGENACRAEAAALLIIGRRVV